MSPPFVPTIIPLTRLQHRSSRTKTDITQQLLGIEASFVALGHPSPAASSRLLVAMSAETAITELAAGRAQADMRRTLFRFAGMSDDADEQRR